MEAHALKRIGVGRRGLDRVVRRAGPVVEPEPHPGRGAAAEAAVGLAILVTFFRNRGDISVDDVSMMKG